MMTKFSFYDANNVLKNANLIFSCEFNNKRYIVYEKEDVQDNEYDIMFVGEYEEVDNKVFIYDVSNDEVDIIKNQISLILRSI